MKKLRILMAALCVAALMCAVTVTAYAGAPDYEETGGYEPPAETVTETPAPEPVAEEEHFELLPGQGFSEDGNLATRDLLYDKYANKQFITVETAGGNLFYIIIDYDKPIDEAGERYETYFLSLVDEADLLALAQSAGVELPRCICKEKCMPGAVNMDCPVCSKNMSECTGAEPAPTVTPEPQVEPTVEPEPARAGNGGALVLILVLAVIAGVGAWYVKIYRPKQQQAAADAEEYVDDPAAYEDAEDYLDEDDGPPWDEDEEE